MSNILAKLDQNESPIPPPLDILGKGILDNIIKEINRYQRKELYEHVRELYADYVGLDKDYVWIQPGVDLFLEDIFIVNNRKRVVMPYPSYFLFLEQVRHYGYEVVKIPLDNGFVEKLLSITRKSRNIVYLDNPNNPTGRIIVGKKDVIPIASREENLILIDEAYYEFCGYTLIDLVEEYRNVVIFRTMSKVFGFAGGRVAFCIMNPSLARKIFYYDIIRFRLSTISLLLAKTLLENKRYINNVVNLVKKERERILHKVRKLGLQAYDSCTNFVMINTGIPEIAKLLHKEGILVKDLGKILGHNFSGYIRVTIGLPRENNIFLDTLEKIVLRER